MLRPGETLGAYVVDAHVGGGGMARVYRGRHALLGHAVALKVLDPALCRHERMRERFLGEGRIMARVRHPSIVDVTDAIVDVDRALAVLVLTFVEGPDLGRVIDRFPGPPRSAFVRRVLGPVLAALHHVHAQGVVHRDVKPGNVLLTRDASGHWHPQLTDFGVAFLPHEADERGGRPPTRSGGLIGTPAYMAPEQARGLGPPDPRWDVWAAGVLLYELASGGRHPFEKHDDRKTLEAVRDGRFEPLPSSVDARIRAAVDAALVVDPDARAASTAELAALLDAEPVDDPALVGLAHVTPESPPPPADVPEPPPVEPSPPAPAPEPRATPLPGARLAPALVAPDGRRVSIGLRPVVLGRSPACDLPLDDPSVSVRHARVFVQGLDVLVEDLLSANGTWVNDTRTRFRRLQAGDRLRLGGVRLVFEAE